MGASPLRGIPAASDPDSLVKGLELQKCIGGRQLFFHPGQFVVHVVASGEWWRLTQGAAWPLASGAS